MRTGNLIKCINAEFTLEQIARIPYRPTKNTIYEVRKMLLTRRGKAVLLYEIENPMLKDEATGMSFEPSFDVRRFVVVDGESGNQIREELTEILENEMV